MSFKLVTLKADDGKRDRVLLVSEAWEATSYPRGGNKDTYVFSVHDERLLDDPTATEAQFESHGNGWTVVVAKSDVVNVQNLVLQVKPRIKTVRVNDDRVYEIREFNS